MARKVQLESKFQRGLKDDILKRFPGSKVFKITNAQGYPDLLILYGKHWATLECKRESGAHRQPNQPYYVDEMNAMSFSRFVYPENKKEVLDDLQSAFET